MRKIMIILVLFVIAFAAGALVTYKLVKKDSVPETGSLAATNTAFTPTSNQPLQLKTSDSPVGNPGALATAASVIEPSVVTIDTAAQQTEWNDFQQPQQVTVPLGTGSGVILSSNGIIVTNNHVINGASRIMVTLYNGKQLPGKVIASDPVSDLAVVKVDATGLTPATLGDSDKLVVGQWVIAVGDPLRVGTTVTSGIVSALHNSGLPPGVGGELASYIQTDAAINPGNSGGALADSEGRLIGINTALKSENGGFVGIGYAIPINEVKKVVEELISTGKVQHPWLGIAFTSLNSQIRQQYNIPSSVQGVIVGGVEPGGPAQVAGVQAGDIITSVNNEAVTSSKVLELAIVTGKVNSQVNLSIWRAGNNVTVSATLGQEPPMQQMQG